MSVNHHSTNKATTTTTTSTSEKWTTMTNNIATLYKDSNNNNEDSLLVSDDPPGGSSMIQQQNHPFVSSSISTTTSMSCCVGDGGDTGSTEPTARAIAAASILHNNINYNINMNFIFMSLLFSANHGCVVACLGLATTRLGSTIGAYQSGLLYGTYTISGMVGSTFVVKELGSRNAMILGMTLYCFYVSAFWIATFTITSSQTTTSLIASMGAILGGIGAGFLWTAQGTYFTESAAAAATASTSAVNSATTTTTNHNHNNNNNLHTTTTTTNHDNNNSNTVRRSSSTALLTNNDNDDESFAARTTTTTLLETNMTSQLASQFAFIYLSSEIGLRVLSSFLVGTIHLSWSTVFAIYAIIAIASTILMIFVHNFDNGHNHHHHNNNSIGEAAITETTSPLPSVWYKITATWQLLRKDRKMKYMIGMNAVFGITSSFLTSYVNGQVVYRVVGSDTYVGLYTAWISIVAATCSVMFGYLANNDNNKASGGIQKGSILVLGAFCFAMVALPFLIYPDIAEWSWMLLLLIYTMHGIGRATFEGTLKATFADFFSYEKEGAFANIIFQNGTASTLGFFLTFTLICSKDENTLLGPYCVTYRDGSIHDVLTFEVLIVLTAILAILGYWRASILHQQEITSTRMNDEQSPLVVDDNPTVAVQ